jgi:hypothetical protein
MLTEINGTRFLQKVSLKVVHEWQTRTGHIHRDTTRVQMAAKMFPLLKLLRWLLMGPTRGFDMKRRNSFLFKFGVFLQ